MEGVLPRSLLRPLPTFNPHDGRVRWVLLLPTVYSRDGCGPSRFNLLEVTGQYVALGPLNCQSDSQTVFCNHHPQLHVGEGNPRGSPAGKLGIWKLLGGDVYILQGAFVSTDLPLFVGNELSVVGVSS